MFPQAKVKTKINPPPAQRQIRALVFQFAGEALIAAKGTSISQTTPDGSNDRRTAP
jgi:hypothetical protein